MLIILIHPVVANTPRHLVRAKYDEEQRYYLSGDLAGQLYPPGRPQPAPDSIRKAIRVQPAPVRAKPKSTKPKPVLPSDKDVVRNEDPPSDG